MPGCELSYRRFINLWKPSEEFCAICEPEFELVEDDVSNKCKLLEHGNYCPENLYKYPSG